jgi:hypothetical protein
VSEQSMAVRSGLTTLPTPADWTTMVAMAKALVQTGFLPQEIKTAEQAVAIILKARELNIPPMYGLSNIAVIKGKPTCNAELMLALVYRDHGDDAIRIEESTPQRCTISYKRRDWPSRQTYSYTIEDAQRAKLTAGATWQSYPQAMLRARCVSAVARMSFPDTIAGMYTPEELGASVRVTDEGRVEVEALPEPQTTNGHRPPEPSEPPMLAVGHYSASEEGLPAVPHDPRDALEMFGAVDPPEVMPETPLRGECRALYLRAQGWPETFKAMKLPELDAPEQEWSLFIDRWQLPVQNAEKAAERRAQNAQRAR